MINVSREISVHFCGIYIMVDFLKRFSKKRKFIKLCCLYIGHAMYVQHHRFAWVVLLLKIMIIETDKIIPKFEENYFS